MSITAAAIETFDTWREGVHEDLVLAVALACWQAEREPPWGPKAIGRDRNGVISGCPPTTIAT